MKNRHRWLDDAVAQKPERTPRTSWWLKESPSGFTRRAQLELAAMNRGKFGAVGRVSQPEELKP